MSKNRPLFLLIVLFLGVQTLTFGQDRLPSMPRYDRYSKLRGEIFGSVKGGDVQVTWSEDSRSFTFNKDGKTMRYDVASKKAAEQKEETVTGALPVPGRQRAAPDRGRQFDSSYSPSGLLKAFSKDRNVFISDLDGSHQVAVTTDGSATKRLKNGIASWVYGEELEVREAMWWSPDNAKLAFYRFDESKVPDYYLQMSQLDIQDKLDVEAYPKAGAPNPSVDLFVYDLASKTTTQVDTKLNRPEVGEYVYDVRWSPDGTELLFNRTNRKQNVMQFCAADPKTGKSRVIVEETRPESWTENHPPMQWLKPVQRKPQRFLWLSERNGYRNIYLGDMTGSPLKPVTSYHFEVAGIVGVDEKNSMVYFRARDGENPYRVQLHRIKMDGTGDKRLTDPAFNHRVEVAGDFKHFVDIEQNLTTPPTTRLCDADGEVIDTIATSDVTKYEALKLKHAERIVFKAADGKTDCYGTITFPSDFDPSKKYPLIVSVYGGPESGTGSESFMLPSPNTELGFIVAWFDGRGTQSRGKAFEEAVYRKLGVVEIDDQNAGVKYLAQRPYIDGKHVGIFGTSYGGYSSVMCLLRHPESFAVAVASSPPTDWRNYDSIYTERYMGLPADGENKPGYDAGSAMTYAKDLKGKLMLYYGTSDNNVHPSNTLQLIRAFELYGKGFDLMVGPDQGHSGVNSARMWEYFIDNLILAPAAAKS